MGTVTPTGLLGQVREGTEPALGRSREQLRVCSAGVSGPLRPGDADRGPGKAREATEEMPCSPAEDSDAPVMV